MKVKKVIKKNGDIKLKKSNKSSLVLKYRTFVKGCSQQQSEFYWLWYLSNSWKEEKNSIIFRELQQFSRRNGLKNIYRYLDGKLTLKNLYDLLRVESMDLYAQLLADNDIAFVAIDAEYIDIGNKAILEGLKEFERIKNLNLDKEAQASLVCTAASTIWFQFMDNLHIRYSLPRVFDLRVLLVAQSAEELSVQISNNFTKFELTEKEISDLKKILGI